MTCFVYQDEWRWIVLLPISEGWQASDYMISGFFLVFHCKSHGMILSVRGGSDLYHFSVSAVDLVMLLP